jgi:hypothetical protein
MKDAVFRRADEIFDAEKTLDLGGIRVRLLWYGGTHTNGDTLISSKATMSFSQAT